MGDRQVEYLPLDEVLAAADPRNPKAHDVDLIDSSISDLGVVDIITRDDRTGLLISGHGRAKTIAAQRDRGDDPPDGVTLAEDGTWLVPVTTGWASRSDDDARKALILMNRATEVGGWVDADLLALLDDLADAEISLDDVGFTDADRLTLRRLAESEDVFTVGTDHMMDEFREISGQDPNAYAPEYARKTVVYLRDQAAVDDFCARLGITDPLGKDLNYPLGWVPNDRRKRPNEPTEEPDA